MPVFPIEIEAARDRVPGGSIIEVDPAQDTQAPQGRVIDIDPTGPPMTVRFETGSRIPYAESTRIVLKKKPLPPVETTVWDRLLEDDGV